MFPISLIFVTLINLAHADKSILTCTHSDEFYYTTPQTNCAFYYRCRSNHIVNYECPLGMMFDFFKQKCVSSTNVCYESTCQGKYDGLYTDTTQACRRYYRCSNELVASYENCKKGYLFNGRACELAEKVTCNVPVLQNNNNNQLISKRSCANYMDECQFSQDGLIPDVNSRDCKSYFKCVNGKSTHLRCPSTTVFNPSEGSCVPDTIYDCPSSSRLDKLCKGKVDGYHSDPRFGCNSFVKCIKGTAVHFDECPLGQVFDHHKRVCVYKSTSLCIHSAKSSSCLYSEIGFYQDKSLESSCQNYYFCYNGRRTTFSCQVGQLFNGEACVDERLYSCSNLDADSCDTKEDGYYKDKNLDCRSYFYCSSNRKYSFLCKDGQAFDGNRCVSKRHVEVCTKNTECVGRSDGYYQDLKSGCTKYFYCKQSDKVQVLTCRNGRIFNGHSCVSPQSYVCPNVGQHLALKLNCVQRKCGGQCAQDGFYADYDSRCKNYYFCVSGNMTKLSCLRNFIFNENEGLCVPQDKYTCPVYCSNECS